MRKAYLNALNQFYFIGPRRIEEALDYFGCAEDIWNAPEEQLKKLPLWEGHAGEFVAGRRQVDINREWSKIEEKGIKVIDREDSGYPGLLKQIYDAPFLLYLEGGLLPGEACVSLVGSRKTTAYGREIAYNLAAGLAARGITVVSGMARGIDTRVHRGALEKGRTVAVLGSGLDVVYPRENRDLKENINQQGAVVSEFPLGTEPLSYNFPRRNRIISGMSLGTVVVEAPVKSGALITADFALEQGREVFAVPGSIRSPYSRGCHKLIKEGARLVEGLEDILDELDIFLEGAKEDGNNPVSKENDTGTDNSPEEETVLLAVPFEAVHMDKIIEKTGFSVSRAGNALLNLELKGLITQLPGKYFMRR